MHGKELLIANHKMELQAIWSRIDQLEKLVISQAKEIDSLRSIIDAQSSSYLNSSPDSTNIGRPQPQPVQQQPQSKQTQQPQQPQQSQQSQQPQQPKQPHQDQRELNQQQQKSIANPLAGKPNFAPFAHASSLSNWLREVKEKKDNETGDPIPVFTQPYVMNPIVHPSSAIPPVTNRPVIATNRPVIATDPIIGPTSKSTQNVPRLITTAANPIPASSSCAVSQMNNNFSRDFHPLQSPADRVPPVSRWSTGQFLSQQPSEVLVNNFEREPDFDSSTQADDDEERNNRQSFLETQEVNPTKVKESDTIQTTVKTKECFVKLKKVDHSELPGCARPVSDDERAIKKLKEQTCDEPRKEKVTALILEDKSIKMEKDATQNKTGHFYVTFAKVPKTEKEIENEKLHQWPYGKQDLLPPNLKRIIQLSPF